MRVLRKDHSENLPHGRVYAGLVLTMVFWMKKGLEIPGPFLMPFLSGNRQFGVSAFLFIPREFLT